METGAAQAEPVKRAEPPRPVGPAQGGARIFAGRFSGRTAIVTGGASGLGFLTAQRILQEGGKVSIWDLTADTLAKAKQTLGEVHSVRVDVSSHADVAEAARQSRAALGRVDILVNCAGITGATVPVQEFPVDDWL